MAVNKIQKFSDINEATLFLNGALIGTALGSAGIPNLVGKKLKFTLPAAVEYTFTAGAGLGGDIYTLSLADIKTQLEGAVAGLRVRSFNNKLVLQEITPTNGVALAPASSNESRALLGLDPVGNIASKVYKPAIISAAPPCWITIENDENSMHTVYTWE